MGYPAHHHKINYIEFPTTDIARTKQFYSLVFGWNFQDWGPDYIGFSSDSGGIDGGFAKIPATQGSGPSAPLVVLYSADLEVTEEAIVAAGGTITVPPFTFPGGRRFHFTDSTGNTLAVWSA